MKIKAIEAWRILRDARDKLIEAGDKNEVGTHAFKLGCSMDAIQTIAGMKSGGKNAILNLPDNYLTEALAA